MPKASKGRAARKSGPVPRTPTQAERQLEAAAIQRILRIGGNMGYNNLSVRERTVVFNQYRFSRTNFERRNTAYRQLAGILTYGLRRGAPGLYYNFSQELLDVIRDAYPSGEDQDWRLTNQGNRPTRDVGVEDLFEDKE